MIRFDDLPRGGQAVTAHLTVKNGHEMLEFYKKAFGAEIGEVHNVPGTDQIMHATLRIGNSEFFLNDEFTQHQVLAPVTAGSSSTTLHIQVSEGLDELFARAIAAGATATMEPADQFWGDRYASFTDPCGHKWGIGMTISNPPTMSDEELRAALKG